MSESGNRPFALANVPATFLSVMALLLVALGWLGWLLLDQDRSLKEQRTRERVDAAAAELEQRGFGGSWGLYAFDLKSRKYEQIRQFPIKSVSLPTWSADGRLMAWFETEPVRQLWMMTNYE